MEADEERHGKGAALVANSRDSQLVSSCGAATGVKEHSIFSR